MQQRRDDITKKVLYKEYIINKKSTREIAKQLKCAQSTIFNRIKEYNIPPRHPNHYYRDRDFPSKIKLELLYVKQSLTIEEISAMHKGIGVNVIRSLLVEYGLYKPINRKSYDIDTRVYTIPSWHWYKIKYRAEIINKDIIITKEQVQELFEKQNGKCALSGVKLWFGTNKRVSDQNASLDRINSSTGYETNNIQWVHKDINFMKRNMSDIRFIELCKLVAENNK